MDLDDDLCEDMGRLQLLACMNVQSRLKRRIIGERLHRVSPIVERAAERESREGAPVIELPERYEGLTFKVRSIRRMANPEPNAPQLIRLVRFPFALDRGYFGRTKLTDFSLARLKRRPYREGFEAGMAAAERTAFPKPTECRARLQPRMRPSVDAWLGEEVSNG